MTLLCDCVDPRTRDQWTPQQCRRCHKRIPRGWDWEIDADYPPAVPEETT